MLTVDKSNLTVLSYRGGHGGEFLIDFFHNQHPGFIPITVSVNPALNSYKISGEFAADQVKLSDNSGTGRFIVKQHTVLEEKFYDPAIRLLITKSSQEFNYFYFFLFTFKAELFMFSRTGVNIPFPPGFFELLERDMFFKWQCNSYEKFGKITTFEEYIASRLEDSWLHDYNLIKKNNPEYIVDLDELFFGDTAEEYKRICNFLGIQPSGNVDLIKEYHQCNVALIEHYLGTSEPEIRKLNTQQFLNLLCDSSIHYMRTR